MPSTPGPTHLLHPFSHRHGPRPPPGQPDHIAKGYCPRLANARLPGSYINHYCGNGGVVVPQFGYPTDKLAIEALQKAYGPSYKVGALSRARAAAPGRQRQCGAVQQRGALNLRLHNMRRGLHPSIQPSAALTARPPLFYCAPQVVGVEGGTREILLNAGNVHCITQQHVLGGI
mgnify:CR=1 FL=1